MTNSKPLIIAAAVFFAMGVASLAALLVYERHSERAFAEIAANGNGLPVYGKAPRFELTDETGRTFNHKQLKGKIWVADFFFSTCAGPCPLMAANLKTVQERFRGRDDLHLVSVTVNPLYDTPAVLKKYAAKVGAETGRWSFLTGKGEEIHRLSVKGFKIGDPDNLIMHSEKFALVDQQGRIRGYYKGTSPEETEEMIRAIRQLTADQGS